MKFSPGGFPVGYVSSAVLFKLDIRDHGSRGEVFDLFMDLAVHADVDFDVDRFDVIEFVCATEDERRLVAVDLTGFQGDAGCAEFEDAGGKEQIGDEIGILEQRFKFGAVLGDRCDLAFDHVGKKDGAGFSLGEDISHGGNQDWLQRFGHGPGPVA